MASRKFLLVLPLVAAAALVGIGLAGADEPAKAPATQPAPAAAAPAEGSTAEAPAPKTPSPVHSMFVWVTSQVAPGVESPCPTTGPGEDAWRAWFDGGANVPLATLRDRLVADGWTADRFVEFFVAAKASSKCCPEETKAGAPAEKVKTGAADAKAGGKCEGCPNCPKGDGECKGDCPDCPGDCAKSGDKKCGGCKKPATAETTTP